jgi:hypothetical protein
MLIFAGCAGSIVGTVYGCSGSSGSEFGGTAGDDSGNVAEGGGPDTPSVFPDTGGSDVTLGVDSPGGCAPNAAASFTPTWIPPASFGQKKCTTNEINAFYTSCLAPNGTNCNLTTACAKCLASNDTDTTAPGPIIFHLNKRYFSFNIAGCIANYTGQPGNNSCGAAYAADVQCKEDLCAGCWSEPGATFTPFKNCEALAGTTATCKPYVQANTTACNGVNAGWCTPTNADTNQTLFERYAEGFCGSGITDAGGGG